MSVSTQAVMGWLNCLDHRAGMLANSYFRTSTPGANKIVGTTNRMLYHDEDSTYLVCKHGKHGTHLSAAVLRCQASIRSKFKTHHNLAWAACSSLRIAVCILKPGIGSDSTSCSRRWVHRTTLAASAGPSGLCPLARVGHPCQPGRLRWGFGT